MTATLQVRIDSELRKAADSVFSDIGMDTNSAIRLFLRQTVIRRTFPFEVISSDPFLHPANQEFLARATADYANGAKNYHTHELLNVDEASSEVRKSTRRASRARVITSEQK